MDAIRCTCDRSNQGRALCPTPERCDALLTGLDDSEARYYCTQCKEMRRQGCFGPRCPGIPKNHPIADDPQIHTDERLRTAHTVDELFGRRHLSPTDWEQPGIPRLARSVVAAVLLLVLLCVAIAMLMEPLS